jgi:hypothetical protein
MSFIRAEAVTGFTFGLVNKTSGAALTGAASGIGKYITKDGGTQASIAGSIAEEGNGLSPASGSNEKWRSLLMPSVAEELGGGGGLHGMEISAGRKASEGNE